MPLAHPQWRWELTGKYPSSQHPELGVLPVGCLLPCLASLHFC